jgi:hypothetical protein
MVARIVMVIAGLKLLELTAPAWPGGPEWLHYSWKDLALIAGGLFLIWKAVTEIHSTVELEDHEQQMDNHRRRAVLLRNHFVFRQANRGFHPPTRRDKNSGPGLSHRNRRNDLHGRNGQASGQAIDLRPDGVCIGHPVPANAAQA